MPFLCNRRTKHIFQVRHLRMEIHTVLSGASTATEKLLHLLSEEAMPFCRNVLSLSFVQFNASTYLGLDINTCCEVLFYILFFKAVKTIKKVGSNRKRHACSPCCTYFHAANSILTGLIAVTVGYWYVNSREGKPVINRQKITNTHHYGRQAVAAQQE
jgi:hypothetical protein